MTGLSAGAVGAARAAEVRATGAGPEEILRVEGLTVEFPAPARRGHGPVRAVDGLDLSLLRGRTLGLVGESGCGKTTLVRTVLGLQRPTRGRILMEGTDLTALGRRARRPWQPRIQVVFQDPYSSLNPRLDVHDLVAEPLRVQRRYDPVRVEALLHQVGLGRVPAGRTAATLSGGQRQRVGIARALALEPDVLVLDEPVSALDVSVRAQIVNLLLDLQADLGLTYLFVAHDLGVVRLVSDAVAVMYQGRIVEQGPAEELFAAPRHPFTRALLDAVPPTRPGVRLPAPPAAPAAPSGPVVGCAFRARCVRARERCGTEVPELRAVTPRSDVACWYPIDAAD